MQAPPSPTMESMPDNRPPSPLEAALDRVGDRWSLLLVEALLDGSRRFGELQTAVAGIAPNILTDRLRRLDREGANRNDQPDEDGYEEMKRPNPGPGTWSLDACHGASDHPSQSRIEQV